MPPPPGLGFDDGVFIIVDVVEVPPGLGGTIDEDPPPGKGLCFGDDPK